MAYLKPSKCQGCPFYNKGKYFTPDSINATSEVLFIAQNPGAKEEAGLQLTKREFFGYGKYQDHEKKVTPQPLIGATGQLFNNKFLPYAGLQRADISVANALRCRPGKALGLKADGLPPLTNKMKLESSKADVVKALKHCKDTYLKIPSSTKLIVTMGAYAFYQMTGLTDITSWRGFAFDYDMYMHNNRTVDTTYYHTLNNDVKLFATMHIAALFKGINKRFYHSVMQDFRKIQRLLNNSWPLQLPSWHSAAPTTWPDYAAFDTEYDPTTNNELIRFSLCDKDYNTYVVEAQDVPEKRIAVSEGSVVLMQNALADIPHLVHLVDFSKLRIEDMMLAHSVLWTGEPHGLNHIHSKYGSTNRYKHLIANEPQLYSALDAYEPMYMWRHSFIPDFKKDTASWHVYRKYRIPLIDIIERAEATGAKIDSARLALVQHTLQARLDDIQQTAKLLTHDEDFNIGGSKKLAAAIYADAV